MAEPTYKTALFQAVGPALVANLAGLKTDVVNLLNFLRDDVNNVNYEGFFGFDDFMEVPTYTAGLNFANLKRFLGAFDTIAVSGHDSGTYQYSHGPFKTDYWQTEAALLDDTISEFRKFRSQFEKYIGTFTGESINFLDLGFAEMIPKLSKTKAQDYYRLRQLLTKVNDDPKHDTTALLAEFPVGTEFDHYLDNPFKSSGNYITAGATKNTLKIVAYHPKIECCKSDGWTDYTYGVILMTTQPIGHSSLAFNGADPDDPDEPDGSPIFYHSVLWWWLNSIYLKKDSWRDEVESEWDTLFPDTAPPFTYFAALNRVSMSKKLLNNLCATVMHSPMYRLSDYYISGFMSEAAWTTILSANEYGYTSGSFNSSYKVLGGDSSKPLDYVYKYDYLTDDYRQYNYDDNAKRTIQAMPMYNYTGSWYTATSTALQPIGSAKSPRVMIFMNQTDKAENQSNLGHFYAAAPTSAVMVMPVHRLVGLHLSKKGFDPQYLCGVKLQDSYS